MKSISLVNPPSPWMISDRALLPLGVLYLASFLRQNGAEVQFTDLSGGEFAKDYQIPEADVYGITFVSPQFVYAKEILQKIRERDPKAVVLAGGVHATSIPESVLNAGFDAVVRGEGELSTLDVLVNGLTKKIYPVDYIKDINSLPFPAWDLIDMKSYTTNLDVMGYMDSGLAEEREINVMGTRGCPGKCNYCTEYKGALRWRTPENVMDEIKTLRDTYGVNRISFCDDNLVVDKKWLAKLCDQLYAVGTKWHCLGRADQVKEETCQVMADAGCMGIDFGIETGAQRMLDIINKNTTVEKQERGIRAAYNAGLKVRAQLMVGLPGETEEDIQETLQFINRNNQYVAKWGVHVFVPFPSCTFWREAEKYGYEIDKNTDFSNFQTIGKPGEWNYIPKDNQAVIAQRRDTLLDAIANKNIYARD